MIESFRENQGKLYRRVLLPHKISNGVKHYWREAILMYMATETFGIMRLY